jgi:hypothetical protein
MYLLHFIKHTCARKIQRKLNWLDLLTSWSNCYVHMTDSSDVAMKRKRNMKRLKEVLFGPMFLSLFFLGFFFLRQGLTMYPRLALNAEAYCLYLSSARTKGVCHHAQPGFIFLGYIFSYATCLNNLYNFFIFIV